MLNRLLFYRVLSKYIFEKGINFLKNTSRDVDPYEEELKKENQVLIEAAEKLNIDVVDHGSGMLEFRNGEEKTFIKGNATELESAVSHKIAGDKFLVSQILSENKLPVANSSCFTLEQFDSAIDYFRQTKKPVAVKPRRGTSGGVGITARVTSERQFEKSFYLASLYDKYVMVEEFIEGENIRLLILKDQMLSAVRRVPAYVTGDGRNSIGQLIKIANRERANSTTFPKLWSIAKTSDLYNTLRQQNLGLRYVPEKDKRVYVKTVCNGHQGGIVEEVTRTVHPDFIKMSVQALRFCKVAFGGVDFITKDISKSFGEAGGIINEINTTPSFYGHYQATNQADIEDSAGKFLKYIFNIDNS
jgi:cyanophycin synthetase